MYQLPAAYSLERGGVQKLSYLDRWQRTMNLVKKATFRVRMATASSKSPPGLMGWYVGSHP